MHPKSFTDKTKCEYITHVLKSIGNSTVNETGSSTAALAHGRLDSRDEARKILETRVLTEGDWRVIQFSKDGHWALCYEFKVAVDKKVVSYKVVD